MVKSSKKRLCCKEYSTKVAEVEKLDENPVKGEFSQFRLKFIYDNCDSNLCTNIFTC